MTAHSDVLKGLNIVSFLLQVVLAHELAMQSGGHVKRLKKNVLLEKMITLLWHNE